MEFKSFGEHINESYKEAIFTLKDLEFEDKGDSEKWQLPKNPQAGMYVGDKRSFDEWKSNFIKKYGRDGEVHVRYNEFYAVAQVKNNRKFSASSRDYDAAISKPGRGWRGD